MHRLGCTLTLLAISGGAAAAQDGAGGGTYSLGVAASILNDPPAWFSNAICPDGHPTRFQIGVGTRLRGPVMLRAAASRYSHDPDLCINGLIPPIPETGPYTARGSQAGPDITGYPFWTVEAHVGVQAFLNEALLGRITIGSIWIPSKNLAGHVGSIGTGLRIPRTPLVVSLTFEKQWLTIPFVDTVVEYFDGQIEDVRVTPRTDHVSPSVWSLGFEWWW